MTESSGFSVLVRRLLVHRGLDENALTGIGEPGLRTALYGSEPDLDLLRRLAPVLRLRLPDLCVMAQVPVPEELAPLDDRAGRQTPYLINDARHASPQSLGRLLAMARALPQQERTRPVPVPRPYEEYPPGFAGVLVNMLRNRNLDWLSAAKTLYLVGGIPPMSASAVGTLGRGRKEMTPYLVAGFAAVLGLEAGDLAAMGGTELPPEAPPVRPHAPEAAELIWEARRLTDEQVRELRRAVS